jgi:hypothetical protein
MGQEKQKGQSLDRPCPLCLANKVYFLNLLLIATSPNKPVASGGQDGVEKRIDALAMAIQMGATVYDLEEAELCYAPPYGSAKDPVNFAGMVPADVLRGEHAALSLGLCGQRVPPRCEESP